MKISQRKKIAATWRKRRERTGHNLEAFAQKHRFGKGQLSRWETGVWLPSTTSVERMETALKSEKV